jgi:hypothetical protein
MQELSAKRYLEFSFFLFAVSVLLSQRFVSLSKTEIFFQFSAMLMEEPNLLEKLVSRHEK